MNLTGQKTQLKRYRWFRVLPVIELLVFILCWQAGFALSQEWATSGTNIYNTNTGNVGIGTMGPGTKLHIVEDNANYAAVVQQNQGMGAILQLKATASDNLNTDPAFDVEIDNFSVFRVTNAGNTGIGTTSPGNKLYVLDAKNDWAVKINQDGGVNDYGNGLYIKTKGTSGTDNHILRLVSGAADVVRFSVKGDGKVGIGTSNPEEQLHVTGNVKIDGNIAAKYQDVAEWVPASAPFPAGTVLILDTAHTNRVAHSSQSYDTRVAGVVSDTPGILLGEAGDNKVKVATMGRVKVKVDATIQPIQVGNLLVSSDKPGMAMRSIPVDLGGTIIHRPGTIIGKALEPLSQGEGEILVLLTLQ